MGYIRKALEKGFSGMYGSWRGRWPPKKVIQGPISSGQRFLAHFEGFSAARILTHVGPYFSGFQPRAPLKAWNWGKPRPEMDSAPSK
jgi:hypothetical protein